MHETTTYNEIKLLRDILSHFMEWLQNEGNSCAICKKKVQVFYCLYELSQLLLIEYFCTEFQMLEVGVIKDDIVFNRCNRECYYAEKNVQSRCYLILNLENRDCVLLSDFLLGDKKIKRNIRSKAILGNDLWRK